MLLTDYAHLLTMAVIGERQGDVAAGAHKIPGDLTQDFRVVQGHLGNKLPGGEVATPFYFKEVSTGKNYRFTGGDSLSKKVWGDIHIRY